MAELPLPYLLLTQPLTVPGSVQPVELWICLNLLDHRATAIGLSRDDAMDRMIATTESLSRQAPAPATPPPIGEKRAGWHLKGDSFRPSSESNR